MITTKDDIGENGIQVEWIINFAKRKCRSLMKTREVVEEMILPDTIFKKQSYFTLIPEDKKGKPNIFISHAWDDIFYCEIAGSGIISILESIDHSLFVWDIFCINQYMLEQVPQKLSYVINNVETLLIVIHEPIWSSRSWCIFELIQAKKHNKEIVLKISPDIWRFLCLSNDFFNSTFRNAESTKIEDKKMIDKIILNEFGSFENADNIFKECILNICDEFELNKNILKEKLKTNKRRCYQHMMYLISKDKDDMCQFEDCVFLHDDLLD